MKSFFAYFLTGMLLMCLFTSCPDDDIVPIEEEMEEEEMENPPLNPLLTVSAGPYYMGCEIGFTAEATLGATKRVEVSNGDVYTASAFSIKFDTPGTYVLTLIATMGDDREETTRSVTVMEQETFSEVYQENDGFTRAHKLYSLPSGGFVSYGDYCRTASTNGSCDLQGFLLQWHDEDGTVRTKRSYSNANLGFVARAITVASDGKVVVAYERITPDGSVPDRLCLLKTGETGERDWVVTRESTWDFNPRALIQTSDGSFVVGGYAQRPNSTDSRAGMYWFTSTGGDGPNEPFGPIGAYARIERLIEKSPGEIIGLMVLDNQIYVANSTNSSIANLGIGNQTVAGLVDAGDGRSISVNSNSTGIQLNLLAANGASIAGGRYAVDGVVLYDALTLDDGNILVSGKREVSGTTRGYIAKLSRSGELIWEENRRLYGRLRGIAITDDCGILGTGYTIPTGAGNAGNQAYVTKLKPSGEL